jgi:hypothetical protein
MVDRQGRLVGEGGEQASLDLAKPGGLAPLGEQHHGADRPLGGAHGHHQHAG